MGFIWFLIGLLSAVSGMILWNMSKRYRLNWIAWSGLLAGVFLILFTIAWCAGSVLEGVPRAASMGLLFFGLPGIIILTFTIRYVDTRLEKLPGADFLSGVVQSEDTFFEKSVPQLEVPREDLPTIEIPFRRRFSRLGKLLGKGVRFFAYASLVAAFVFGMASSKKDYETMIKVRFPHEKLVKINNDPVVFEVGEKIGGMGNYIVITEGQGYGGPFVIGVRIMDDAKVHEVMLLDNRETPSFRERVEDANFPAQFAGKSVADNFLPDDDIDIVTGATISTMATTQAIRSAAHIAATRYFEMEAKWRDEPWNLGLSEGLILLIFIGTLIPAVSVKKPWRYIFMAVTVAVVGFYLNASISIGLLSGLVMGFIPALKTHLIWWILIVGTLGVLLVTGKNVYCFKICPFYGIQYVFGKIGGGKFRPPSIFLKHSSLILNFLLWLSLLIIFISANPAMGSYEPFAMMFSLDGIGLQWFLLPLALIGSFFSSAFWCRFFCPCGHALTKLRQYRAVLLDTIKRKTGK